MVQYKAALVITGATNGTSRDRLYQEEFGLESLTDRRWFYRLFFFHKIITGLIHHLIFKLTIMLLVKERI